MSKVVFLGFPGHGHINPTIGVVKELISRGEQVFYYATPEFKQKVKSTGADFCDYQISMDNKIDFLEKLFKRKIDFGALNQLGQETIGRMNLYFKILKNKKQDLLKILTKIKPDYVIHDSCANWGKTLARQLGIPAISSVTTFAYCDQILELHPDFVIRNILKMPVHYSNHPQETRKIIQRISQKIGNLFDIPDYDYFDIAFSHEAFNIVYTSKEFQIFSEVFDSGFKFVGPSLDLRRDSGGFPLGKLTGENLIYISFGTVWSDTPSHFDFYRKCFAVLGNTGKQVVLNIGDVNPRKLGRFPSNFIVRRSVPQLEILKRADLFITHGGMNSANEALYFNVPMIVIPQRVDQFLVADRVAELGVGIKLKNEALSVEALSEAVEQIFTTESYRQRSREIGESLRATGGYQQAADEIFNFKVEMGIK